MTVITLSDLSAEIEWKAIKNVHLTIYPPDARIHVSAPLAMTEDAVRLFLITKLPWIGNVCRRFSIKTARRLANMFREKITITKDNGIV